MLKLYLTRGALSRIDEEALLSSVAEPRKAHVIRRRKEDRIASAAASCLLRYALCDAGYPELSDESVTWEGKPHFTDPNISQKFNLSHTVSRECDLFAAAVLLSDGDEVGVDLEFPRRLHNRDALMRRLFTEEERNAVLSSDMNFFRIWCAKEAFVKWTGEGFSRPLSTVSVDLISQTAKSGEFFCDLRWLEVGGCTVCAAAGTLSGEICAESVTVDAIIKNQHMREE